MGEKVVGLDGKPVDNVVPLDIETTLDIPVDAVLDAAKSENLMQVLVIGMREDGQTYYASSYSDIGEMLLQTEIFKRQMIETAISG